MASTAPEIGPGRRRLARPVARLTATSEAPGSARSTRSTRATQEAQVRPSTGRLTGRPGAGMTGFRVVSMSLMWGCLPRNGQGRPIVIVRWRRTGCRRLSEGPNTGAELPVFDSFPAPCDGPKMSNTPTRNIALTHELESYIRGQVASGHYANASEVVRAGLRLLIERDHKLPRSRGVIVKSVDLG